MGGAGGGRGAGVGFLLKKEGRVSPEREGGLRGWEAVCGELGGGLNIFFRGRNAHQA